MDVRRTIVPVGLGLALGGVLVIGWNYLTQRERAELDARLDVSVRLVAERLEGLLAQRVAGVNELAVDLAAASDLREADFRERSRAHQREHPGFQALSWIEPGGRILWAEPHDENREAEGFDISQHPFASEAFLSALTADVVGVTPPIELLQGGRGLVIYRRVGSIAEPRGVLNGVFRVATLLDMCVSDRGDDPFDYMLREVDDDAAGSGREPDRGPVAHAAFDVAGRSLSLSALAPRYAGAADGTWVDEAALLSALLLAGGLAWMGYLASRRQHVAEEVAERLSVLVENAPDAIASIDVDSGLFVAGNERAHQLFGVERGALHETGPVELSPDRQPELGDPADAFLASVRAAAAGEPVRFEWTFESLKGDAFPAEVQLVRLPDTERALVRASITDVTERRALEQRLRRSEALEAMGQLAGGVAHDFNNMLSAALGASDLIHMRSDDPDVRSLARRASDACMRAGALTRQLLAFSRHSVLRPEPLDLAALVEDMRSVLVGVLGERVTLRVEREPGVPAVIADRSQLELVVLNLAVNARDAMPEGGTLVFAVAARDGLVCLRAEDDGEGIAPEDVERVFEPFFTTKGPGAGTGIGLATVQRVVQQAGGRVEVSSRPGQGTTFEICLPASDVTPVALTSHEPCATSPGEGRVLVVEDDVAVRAILREELTEAGYDVVDTSDAGATLQLSEETLRSIDVLVTDIVLPDDDGLRLARQLRERVDRPIATLFISGYAEKDIDLTCFDDAHVDLLLKPFSPAALTERVTELIDALASGGAGRRPPPTSPR